MKFANFFYLMMLLALLRVKMGLSLFKIYVTKLASTSTSG
jgi:hypothetical protein